MLQTDFGAFVVIAVVAMGLLFLAGVSAGLFTSMVFLVGGIFALIITLSPWRRERIFAYLDPFSAQYALDKGYQLTHALIALGRGEIFGVGLGASVEKLHYLPEAHTDFLLAVIGEELGLAAVMLIIVAFFWFVRRAFAIGRLAIKLDRPYGGLVAQGIGLWIGFQAFINIGVNTGLLPTKGLTLPLMSYGGSAIIVNCIAIAILLRVDFENRRLMRGGG
jgi:cell division protein FtsW